MHKAVKLNSTNTESKKVKWKSTATSVPGCEETCCSCITGGLCENKQEMCFEAWICFNCAPDHFVSSLTVWPPLTCSRLVHFPPLSADSCNAAAACYPKQLCLLSSEDMKWLFKCSLYQSKNAFHIPASHNDQIDGKIKSKYRTQDWCYKHYILAVYSNCIWLRKVQDVTFQRDQFVCNWTRLDLTSVNLDTLCNMPCY